ncbi:MAG: FHA domain-containing protein [Proteobacteria bacterium]|nr:FHA domain-containing protein [Pseudomonadota bacterium]
MFKKFSQLLGGDKREEAIKPAPKQTSSTNPVIKKAVDPNPSNKPEPEVFESIANVISASGRISLEYLKEVAKALDEREFIKYIQHPVLAGAGIHEGFLSSTENQSSMPNRRKKTLMFIPARRIMEEIKNNVENAPLQQAIFCITKSNEAFTKDPNLVVIGRETDNDIIIPDFAVSKNHAQITIEDNNYCLTDIGSSNGTLVNEHKISTQVILKDKDIITFARFQATFLMPKTLYGYLRK